MSKTNRSVLLSAALALLVAAAAAVLMEVRGLFSGPDPDSPALLSLSDAVADQCVVSGNEVRSLGRDPKLVWKRFSADPFWLDIDVEAKEETFVEAFWGTPDRRGFSRHRRSGRPLRAGENRVSISIPEKARGLRIDLGQEPGNRFRVRSIALRRGPHLDAPWSWRTFLLRVALLSGPLFLLAVHCLLPWDHIWRFVDRNRFAIAAAVFAFFLAFELHGSSIGIWNRFVPNAAAEAPLFGTERRIRSDEYAVFTPMTLAQSFAKPAWPYFNDIPRAARTDMFSVYAQPVRHPLLAFRPFLAGHVLFGFRRGLAFFWAGRWLALLLVAYELLKLLTDGNRTLSGVGAAMIVLSPVVQWWGAINALAEMLVFGSLFVLCLDRFLRGASLRDRWLPAVGMGYSGVAYAMTLYPAAMIPLAYVFAALSAWVVLRRARQVRIDARSALFALAVAVAAAGCLAWYLSLSRESFRIMAGTVYPGTRFDCGGGFGKGFGLSWGSLFFPWTTHAVEEGNPFNRSTFLDFFPLGYALAACLFVRRRKPDLPLALLLAVSVPLGVYCAAGFPEWAAKGSLLSRSTAPRAFVALGFAQFLAVIRAVSLLRRAPPVRAALAMAAGLALLDAALARFALPLYLARGRLLPVVLAALAGNYLFLRFPSHRRTAAAFFTGLAVLAGAFVNPLQRGDAGILDSDLARTVRSIAEADGGAWLVEGESFPMNQYPLLAGAPTVNAGNLCPAVERWRALDPDGRSERTWNRYAAGIRIDLGPEAGTEIALTGFDTFRVSAPPSLLNALGVRYLMSRRDVSALSDGTVSLEPVARASGWGIYRVGAPPRP